MSHGHDAREHHSDGHFTHPGKVPVTSFNNYSEAYPVSILFYRFRENDERLKLAFNVR